MKSGKEQLKTVNILFIESKSAQALLIVPRLLSQDAKGSLRSKLSSRYSCMVLECVHFILLAKVPRPDFLRQNVQFTKI